ncbi:MAG: hypothetical protein IT371_13495 [Deltaproteobacteria bacterium]|nr:hypothetical protein [Deltaproteobacteria bacterium]
MRVHAWILAGLIGAPGTSGAAPLAVEVEDAADHHVAAQGRYRGGLKDSWEWQLGTRRSAPNITGVSAHGLLAAHRITRLKEHEDSALRAADALVAAYDAGWKGNRPYTQDLEFLVAAGYVVDAARWFRVLSQNYTPAGYVDHLIRHRGGQGLVNMAGWDAASAIRAAVAVGDVAYARGMLERVVERRGAWDLYGAGDAQRLSHASLLWAIAVFKGRSRLSPEVEQFTQASLRALVGSQSPAGAWETELGGRLCTQTTAYAVLGLAGHAQGRGAAARGRRWLLHVAEKDQRYFVGGRIWAATYRRDGRPMGPYVSEIQSEVLQALASGTRR